MVLKKVMGCPTPNAEMQITWGWFPLGIEMLQPEGLLSWHKKGMSTSDNKYEPI